MTITPVARFKHLTHRCERIDLLYDVLVEQWLARVPGAFDRVQRMHRILNRLDKRLSSFCSKHFEHPDLIIFFKLSDYQPDSFKPFSRLRIKVEYGNYLLGGDDLDFKSWIQYTRNPR